MFNCVENNLNGWGGEREVVKTKSGPKHMWIYYSKIGEKISDLIFASNIRSFHATNEQKNSKWNKLTKEAHVSRNGIKNTCDNFLVVIFLRHEQYPTQIISLFLIYIFFYFSLIIFFLVFLFFCGQEKQ